MLLTPAFSLDPLGFERITGLSSAKGLTIPAGTSLALITPESIPVRWRDDGTDPTAGVGYPLEVGAELQADSAKLPRIKFIETGASSVLCVVYYGRLPT